MPPKKCFFKLFGGIPEVRLDSIERKQLRVETLEDRAFYDLYVGLK